MYQTRPKVYRFLSRLKFLLSATNQHGVHSPFIYGFVTKGLYRKGNTKFSVTENVLLKSIAYFKLKKIGLATDSNDLKIRLNAIFEGLEYQTFPFDLIYANEHTNPFTSISEKQIHNDSMLLVQDIYETKERLYKWNELRNNPQVTVSIDLYYCGILFFRKEQAKEHFKIRI